MTIEENHANDHESGREKPSYDDVNTPVIVMVGLISAVLTYAIVALVQGMTYHMEFNMIKKRSYDRENYASVQAIDQQKANLLANDAGRISIDDAIETTLTKLDRSEASEKEEKEQE